MRALLLLPFFCLASSASAQPPNTEWLATAGGFDQNTPNRSAIDPTGGIYTSAYGEEPRNYGDGVTVVDSGFTIARYTAAGDIVWARPLTIDHPMEVYVDNIATNSTGDLWVSGYFHSQTLTIDGITLNTAGGATGFLARFDSNGDAQFATSWGDATGNSMHFELFVDALDRVYVIGTSNSAAITIDGVSLTNTGTGSQMVVLRFDANGNAEWGAMSSGPLDGTTGLNVAVDEGGNIYATVRFNETLVIDGLSLVTPLANNVALVRFGPAGGVEWIDSVIAVCDPLDLAVDAQGVAYVCGYIQAEADFDGDVLTPSVLDGFVSSYFPNGDFRWVVGVQGEIDNELCWSVELEEGEESLIVAGTFVISAMFGTIPMSTGSSPTDGFVMHMDTSGAVNWVKDMTGDGPSLFAEAHLAPDGHIIVSGTTQSQDTYLGEEVFNGIGNQAFLARFGDHLMGLPPIVDDAAFGIHPNPSNGTFVVDLPNDARSVIISDALGCEEQRLSVVGMTIRALQVEETGIHFITVETGSERHVRKLVID